MVPTQKVDETWTQRDPSEMTREEYNEAVSTYQVGKRTWYLRSRPTRYIIRSTFPR